MCATRVNADTLKRLEPIGSLSKARLEELGEMCHVDTTGPNADPFAIRGIAGEAVYLLHGELALTYQNGAAVVLVGGSEEASHPLGRRGGFVAARAITDIELLRIDEDLLDILVTWDQVAAVETTGAAGTDKDAAPSLTNWNIMSGMFSASSLKYGAFSQLPPAHIDELLKRFRRIEVRKGDVVVREGAEGDFYYVIESGKCTVERMIGGVSMLLAELKAGDAFGEEALVSEAKRNATVSMKTAGALLRLDKKDFVELLREPLLRRISMDSARQKVAAGGQWVDVRYPSEYQYDHLPGAISVPLSEIRNAFGLLGKEREYVLYCQSERRSAAAAFLLAQRGYRAFLLAGGLWATRARVAS
jgi:rhodanese-related sulfurtransferase